MSFGQAILALVTLAVATIIYRWQKTVDRNLSIERELREAYACYLAAESRLMVACQSATRPETRSNALKEFDIAMADAISQLKVVQLMAPKDVSVALGDHCNAMLALAWAAAIAGIEDGETSKEELVEKYNAEVTKISEILRDAFTIRHSGFWGKKNFWT